MNSTKVTPPPRYVVGQFVKFRLQDDAIVKEVVNSGLGFNLYEIQSISTGKKIRAKSRELSSAQELEALFDDNFDMDIATFQVSVNLSNIHLSN